MINEKIRVVFIETSNGKRVLFYGTLSTDYSKFRDIFLELASGRVSEICLNDIPAFFIQEKLVIKMIAQDKIDTPTVSVNNDLDNNYDCQIVYWIMSFEYWRYFYDCLEGFASENTPCHQYLAFDDLAIIPMISKGEYNDEIFREHFDKQH